MNLSRAMKIQGVLSDEGYVANTKRVKQLNSKFIWTVIVEADEQIRLEIQQKIDKFYGENKFTVNPGSDGLCTVSQIEDKDGHD